MRHTFNVYEIEDLSDEDRALNDLHKAGCQSIKVVARDYEDSVIRVECDMPSGTFHAHQLNLETTVV